MANPSLQIGNGKFAIKENDLLGYSSSGTRFFPIPITMTRATLGTRVNPSGLIENVELSGTVTNLARVDYTDGTGSLLVEPQRTNLITYSEDFSNASWLKVNSTVNPNTSVSPDGTLNSDEFIPDNTTASIFIYNQITFSASDYTLSFFIKYNGRQYVQLLFGSNVSFDFSNFDLINHTVTSGNGNIEDYGNDWYKISLTSNVSAGSSEVYLWSIDSATSLRASSSTGNGTDGYYVYGGQLEQGSYPTSYIKTQGSTVTRNADQYEKTGISNLIGQTEGTVFVDVDFDTLSGLNMFLSIRPDASNKIEIYRDGNIIYGEIASSSSFTFSKTGVTVGRYKIAVAYSSGSSAMYINGNLISSNSTPFTFTSTLNDLNVGSRGGTSFIEQSRYNDIKLYKTRLSNSELATLTTI